ncbi:hypothetical protein Q7O_004262 [Pectobacterium carotovorum subsp. carotovorum PCCS1]|nr:hypothetical protein [Pectobacterium carotovorum subsp. carotovorum PCCS1]
MDEVVIDKKRHYNHNFHMDNMIAIGKTERRDSWQNSVSNPHCCSLLFPLYFP